MVAEWEVPSVWLFTHCFIRLIFSFKSKDSRIGSFAFTTFKMTKRTNEDAHSEEEPSAKRSITSEQQEAHKLQEAQDTLDRLDYKTVEELCTKVSDLTQYTGWDESDWDLPSFCLSLESCLTSPPSSLRTQMIYSESIDSVQPLLVRSKSLGSRGEAYEAVEDVEKASKWGRIFRSVQSKASIPSNPAVNWLLSTKTFIFEFIDSSQSNVRLTWSLRNRSTTTTTKWKPLHLLTEPSRSWEKKSNPPRR